ncbi:protein kinase [Microcoleus sp. FACHB-1515]|uniref:serine/threonine-protein kinase n=1 Tax=Cyanophyceae TaxID=3028117 RepID=UPI001689B6D5|nr:serine/threonine-protein kinase [Microcoleus sp. FACHB-1515]MBD2090145.1 protein kinase [Microcoleus sp. FACHB-1515]
MTYCSQGHPNTLGSRFCASCGEKLSPQTIETGLVLGDRYQIQSELGHGGFGRTYLACDRNRFNEPCVLKEFAPQVQAAEALQKAEELFAREAGVLYQLQHPQIPRFRELFRAHVGGRDRLFLVQDYVTGKNYRQLLNARSQPFSEAEIATLLRQLLPVLHYIHSIGVIHRDISPDNLIQRETDFLPVLIDFGGVKQIAASVSQMAHTPSSATLLGKVGYAPPEQMHAGIVSPDSDLYALAMTALVLRIGKEPQDISATWRDAFTPPLQTVLAKMLALQPIDRYPNAIAVLQALDATSLPTSASTPIPTPTPVPIATVAAVPPAPVAEKKSSVGKIALLAVFAAAIGFTWGTRNLWLPPASEPTEPTPTATPLPVESPSPTPTSNFSAAERARKAALRDRREALGVPQPFYTAITNTTFFERYPNQQGRTLSDSKEDEIWRDRWDQIAGDWLDWFEENLSSQARRNLGSYGDDDLARFRQQINALGVGSGTLNDLTDAKFFHLFPDQRGKTEQDGFLTSPIGQVWQAIAADQVQALQSGDTLEKVEFAPGTTSDRLTATLAPGEGRVYTATLQTGQLLGIKLQAPNTRLSVYPPRPTAEQPFLLSDSEEKTWSATLPQSGIYEIVVISTASQPIDVELSIAAESIAPEPAPPPADDSAEPSEDDSN